jgi:hypothetical protein
VVAFGGYRFRRAANRLPERFWAIGGARHAADWRDLELMTELPAPLGLDGVLLPPFNMALGVALVWRRVVSRASSRLLVLTRSRESLRSNAVSRSSHVTCPWASFSRRSERAIRSIAFSSRTNRVCRVMGEAHPANRQTCTVLLEPTLDRNEFLVAASRSRGQLLTTPRLDGLCDGASRCGLAINGALGLGKLECGRDFTLRPQFDDTPEFGIALPANGRQRCSLDNLSHKSSSQRRRRWAATACGRRLESAWRHSSRLHRRPPARGLCAIIPEWSGPRAVQPHRPAARFASRRTPPASPVASQASTARASIPSSSVNIRAVRQACAAAITRYPSRTRGRRARV